jgi:hypothetical protein
MPVVDMGLGKTFVKESEMIIINIIIRIQIIYKSQ